MNANTKYEIQAHAFNIMTGYMAPGKDSPAVAGGYSYAEREEAWNQWHDKHHECISAMLRAFSCWIGSDK